jgi:hypothetical protein
MRLMLNKMKNSKTVSNPFFILPTQINYFFLKKIIIGQEISNKIPFIGYQKNGIYQGKN